MAGPRLTAPASKLVRAISTTATTMPKSSTLLTSSKSATPLMRKYAVLLEERNLDGDHSRKLYTRSSNRPHPPPRHMRLMQPFTSSAAPAARADRSTIDFAVLPSAQSLETAAVDPYSHIRVPILPDNYNVHLPREAADEPVFIPEISVAAADGSAAVSALTEVEGMGVDNVELRFTDKEEPTRLTDIWAGLVDDVLGQGSNRRKFAV